MKKLVLLNIFTLLLIVGFISCKKDNDNTPPDYLPGIAGGWRFVSEVSTPWTFMGDAKYLQLYSSSTYSLLVSGDIGLHDRQDGMLSVSDKQMMLEITMQGPMSVFFNYTVKHDTLTLTRPGSRIVWVRDASAPDTSAWIKKVSAVTKFKAPVRDANDITYDGTYLWYGNGYDSHYLYKITPSSGATDSILISASAFTVEFDGADLWVSDDGSASIQKINRTTGATVFTSPDMGAWIYGIARDGNFLWCYSNNENKLYKYSMSSNTVVSTISVQPYLRGLAFANNYLYMVYVGKLYKCTASPLQAVASFELHGYNFGGVAYDGTSFWVSAAHENETGQSIYEIIKLSGVE